MSSDIVEQAILLIKEGKTEQGGKILVDVLKKNPEIERAWAWLYACARTDEQRIYCLKKVLAINPKHERAKAALEKLLAQKQTKPDTTRKVRTKIKGKSPLPRRGNLKDGKNAAEIKIPVVPPKIIIVKSGENLYAAPEFVASDFFPVDSGMLGGRLSIGGLTITSYEYPKCIGAGYPLSRKHCDTCEFFSYLDCPLSRDAELLHEVKTLFNQSKQRWLEYQERRNSAIDAIYLELKEHGRPLHYHVLAKIIKERYPELKLNAKRILHYMMWHRDKFEWVDTGVYRAK